MLSLIRLPGLSRKRVARLHESCRAAGEALRAVRYPNALLSSMVLVPVLVFGVSFSDRTADARESLAATLTSVAAHTGFGVKAITIEGLRDTREGDVLDYMAVTTTTSVLGFDIDAARERVLALPWVKEASVRRVYPDTLMVQIEEHAPFARMFTQDRILLVTLDGEEITDEIGAAHARLPLVVGEGAAREATDFFAHLAARPYVLDDVVALERVGDRRWTLHMGGDVQIHLPEIGVDVALGQLESMMRRYALLERAVAEVDLRLPDQLVVRLTDGAVEAMEGEADALTTAQGGA